MPNIQGDVWEHVLEEPELSGFLQFLGNPL